MASRSGGRSDERSNARSASGRATPGGSAGGNRAGGGGSSTTTSGTRGTAQNAQTSRPGGATGGSSGSSGMNASGGQVSTGQGGTRMQATADRVSGSAASQTQNQSNASNRVESGASTGPSAGPARGDQQRELRTSREQGNMRPSSSAQRSNVDAQGGSFGTPILAPGGNPFAMMRRMMDDMDRLFSDFGFIHPGNLASSLLSPELWHSNQSTPRALGGGSSSAARSSPAAGRGQQGLQRGGQQGLQQSMLRGGLWSPQVEVFERGNNLVVRTDLPGLSREDVDVEIDDDALIIRGERHSDVEDEDEGFYRSERSYGSFYRAIPLPDNVDASACNATFKDGVLEVTLPKPPQQASRARKIDVR